MAHMVAAYNHSRTLMIIEVTSADPCWGGAYKLGSPSLACEGAEYEHNSLLIGSRGRHTTAPWHHANAHVLLYTRTNRYAQSI